MRNLVLGFSALFLLACSSSTSGGDDSTSSGMETPQDQVMLTTPEYTVKSGQEIRYLCTTFHLPADKETIITEIDPVYGRATHHLGVFAPITEEKDGTYPCDTLFKPTWIPVYAGGKDSTKLVMPEGAGMHLKAGQQILIQLHLLNTTDSDVTDKATVGFKTSDDTKLVGAGIYGLDDTKVKIPPQSDNYELGMQCKASQDMDVFAVFGHMHQLGTKIDVSRGAKAGDDMLYSQTWDFNNQPTTPATFHVAKGDQLNLQCFYNNDTAKEVDYGESTFNEMCIFVFYYTPYSQLGGCIQ